MLDLTKMNPIRFLQKVHIIDGQNGEEPFVTSKREDEEVLFLIHNPYYKDLVSEIRELGNVTDKTYLNEKISFLKSTFAKHGSGWDKILKSHLITGIVGYKPLSELRLQEIPENQEVCIYIQSGTTIDDIKDHWSEIQNSLEVLEVKKTRKKILERDLMIFNMAQSGKSITQINIALNEEKDLNLSHIRKIYSTILNSMDPLPESYRTSLNIDNYDSQKYS